MSNDVSNSVSLTVQLHQKMNQAFGRAGCEIIFKSNLYLIIKVMNIFEQ